MSRPAVLASIAAATVLGAGAARAQPYGISAQRWGSAELTVGHIDLGREDPERRTLVGLLVQGGVVVDSRFGFGLDLPVARAYGGAGDRVQLGNLTPSMFWVVYRGLERWRMSAWLSGSLSVRLGAGESQIGSLGAFTRFWLPDPGLYDPDRHTARGGAHYRLAGERLFGRIDLRSDYAFGSEDDRLRALLAARAGWRFTGHLSAHAALTGVFLPDPAGAEPHLRYAAELGGAIAAGARDRVALSAYLPLGEVDRERSAFGIIVGYAATF